MGTRKTHATAAAPVAVQPAGWSAAADAGRQQMAVATESADALLRGFEAIRKINDRAVRGAVARYGTAARKLKAPRQPMDLITIPSEFLRGEIEGAASYWQELSGAAMEMQAELLGCSSHLVDSDAVLQTASVMDALPAVPGFPDFNNLLGTGRGRATAGARRAAGGA